MDRGPRKGRPRGRSGGRAGGAGYDFQDLYVAFQLAKLLMGDRNPIAEVMWEKKAVDWGDAEKSHAEAVHVDDAIIHLHSGKRVYVQLKETAPAGGWSAAQIAQSGIALQLWRQWSSATPERRTRTVLRLASAGDVTPLTLLVDAALRSRTPAELASDEASAEVARDVEILGKALSLSVDNRQLLAFLKSIQAEQLPAADELENLIVRSLAPFGPSAADLAGRLIRLVARSKHAGPSARCSHTRDSLVAQLREEGVPYKALVAAGLVKAGRVHDDTFWDAYRAQVVRSFRTFRVYGLQVERPVFADLPVLFVPLRLAPIAPGQSRADKSLPDQAGGKSLEEKLFAEEEADEGEEIYDVEAESDLAKVLGEHRRIGLIGGPGCGKTTTLKWLAIISTLPGSKGRQARVKFGLGAEPLVPLYVRFRQLAERVRARGLEGIEGRVGLVAEFIAAEFEVGLSGNLLTRGAALQIARELLDSDKTLLLFDGLDEVADEPMRNRLFDAVADLMKTYGQPRVVVTSRPYAFHSERSPLEVVLFEPLPLDRAGRRAFARQWYRAVRTHVGPTIPETELVQRADSLAKAAEAHSDIAQVPLLLSILALVHFNKQGLPVERATLYDHATLAMLGHWDRDPAGRDLGAAAIPLDWATRLQLSEQQIRQVVECLAYRIHCREGGGEFSEQVAIEALAEGLGHVSESSRFPAIEQAQLLLRLLVDRSGLVQERSPGVFGFAHLTFQEYLTARWIVGEGEQGLRELVGLASDERYAEVIRLGVAILVSDHRAPSKERVEALISEIGSVNAIVAAACLLEVPGLHLEGATAESLARAVWSGCIDMRHHRKHASLAPRLIWAALEKTPRADEILLEVLSQEMGHPMGLEMALEVLIARPPGPLTPQLAWVLQRLSMADNSRWHIRLGSLATLVLVEGDAVRAEDQLPALVHCLGERDWGRRIRNTKNTPSTRAERILVDLWQKQETRHKVREALETALRPPESDDAFRAAQLLFSLGEQKSLALADALVQGGRYSLDSDEELRAQLRALVGYPHTRAVAVAALEKGLTSDRSDVRRACSLILRDAGVLLPASVTASAEHEEEADQLARLRQLLTEPSTASQSLAALAEALWDEDEDAAWYAARALVNADHADTPGVPQALVNAGLKSEESRQVASGHLRDLRSVPRLNLSVRAALLDGIRSKEGGVATASARLLLEMGDVQGEARLSRVIRAIIRDSSQLSQVLPYLQQLINQESTCPIVLKSLGEYLGGETVQKVAFGVARMLAKAGYLDTPNLARGLVLGGFGEIAAHEEVIGYLSQMLDDPELVTDTRKALSSGLSSKTSGVAWGAACFLWEAGSRTDPELPDVIVGVGLKDPGRREQAREWIIQLLSEPRTAHRTREALETAAYEALNKSSEYQNDYELAWEIGVCLIEAKALYAKHLADTVVFGGLADRERHAEVIATIQRLLNGGGELSQEIQEKLWDALRRERHAIGWGAARTLIEAVGVLADKQLEAERSALLLRVVLRETDEIAARAELLGKLSDHSDETKVMHGSWLQLLDDQDVSVAYAAARHLVDVGDTQHAGLADALVRGGLTWHPRHEEAARILDGLRAHLPTAPTVTEALNKALWGTDPEAASAAAVYLMDRGERANPGIPRGLVFSGMHYEAESEVERRLLSLLDDPNSRSVAIDALNAALYGDRGDHFPVASLLVRAGAQLHDLLVAELNITCDRSPVALLAVLALTGRAREVRDAAQRLSLSALVDLIGDEPFPLGITEVS